jgi:predicted oxidoreductase (fatty acid repression mutant protein)
MSDSFFLFAQPSFIEGMARVLDLGNNLNVYNESPNDHIADSEALKTDWNLVGQDISKAITEVKEKEIVEKPTK